jgi:hypothetical protein
MVDGDCGCRYWLPVGEVAYGVVYVGVWYGEAEKGE